jgi:hypothetical protein
MPNLENEETRDKLNRIIDYYANPLDDRTIKQFCEMEGISESTFGRYKKEFRDEIFKKAEARREIYKAELRSSMYRAIAMRMRKSDNATKLMAQLLGDLVERVEQTNKYETVEQKKNRLSDLLKNAGLKVTLETKQDAPSPDNTNK